MLKRILLILMTAALLLPLAVPVMAATETASSTGDYLIDYGVEGTALPTFSYSSGSVSDGVLNVSVTTDAKPRLAYTGLSIDASKISEIRIKAYVPVASQVKLYFAQKGVSYSESTCFKKTITGVEKNSWQEFVFDTSTNSNWNGTIIQLRFDFTSAKSDFKLEYIKFIGSPVDGVANGAGWTMDLRNLGQNDHPYFYGYDSRPNMDNGALKVIAKAANPRLIYNGKTFSVDASKISQIRIMAKAPEGANDIRFFFANSTSDFSGTSRFTTTNITPNQWQEIILDTSTASTWTGTITKFRIDFTGVVVNSEYEIKYIKFIEAGKEPAPEDTPPVDGKVDGNGWKIDFTALADNTKTYFYGSSIDSKLAISGGTMLVDTAEADQRITYCGETFGVNTFNVSRIEILLNAPATFTDFKFYFAAEGKDFGSDRCFTAIELSGAGKIIIDTHRLTTWTGNISKFAFEFSGASSGYSIKSIRFYLPNDSRWFTDKDPATDYEYSFCVVGDTQILTERYPSKLATIYDWILDNKDEKKIEHVFGLGDIIQYGTDAEWDIAKEAISRLDGKIPYSLVRGSSNHDSQAGYNEKFGTEWYRSQFMGFYGDGIENSYRTFRAGSVDYLFVTLEFGPSDAVLNWAGNVIDSYPNHRVIITTHMYLYRDGTTLDENDEAPARKPGVAADGTKNNGDEMWEKLIRKHKNIFMVLCGHDASSTIVKRESLGDYGNTIIEVLINPQGVDGGQTPAGMVAMFYFSNDGQTVEVEYYSTIREMYYMPENQFTIELPEYKSTGTGICGNALTLGSDVKVQFLFDVDSAVVEGAYAEIGRKSDFADGNTVKIAVSNLSTKESGGKRYYVVEYGVPAKDLETLIVARIVKDGKIISTEYVYSAQDYIDTVLASEIGGDITAELKALVRALDVYGKNAAAVLSGGAPQETVTGADFSSVAAVSGNRKGDGIKLDKFTLELKSNIILRVYFKLSGVNAADVIAKINGESVAITSMGNGVYCIETSVVAAYLGENYTFTVTSGENELSLTLSALYYAKTVVSSAKSNDADKNLMNAIKLYYDAAVEYAK